MSIQAAAELIAEMRSPSNGWRTETRHINSRRVTTVVRGYGSSAEYMRSADGTIQQFTAASARAAIAKATGAA